MKAFLKTNWELLITIIVLGVAYAFTSPGAGEVTVGLWLFYNFGKLLYLIFIKEKD